jgi:Transposase domain (DUF772)
MASSDSEAVARLVDTPNWQYFCGYRYQIRNKAPFARSMLSQFRRKMGEEGARRIFETSAHIALSKARRV